MIEKARVNGIELGYELTPAKGAAAAAGEGRPSAAGAAASAAGASSEAVIFLNGIAMTTVHWKPFVEALPAFARLTHDFRGQVLSERPAGPYHLSDHVEDLGPSRFAGHRTLPPRGHFLRFGRRISLCARAP